MGESKLEVRVDLTWPREQPLDHFDNRLLTFTVGEVVVLEFSAVRASNSVKVVQQWRLEGEPEPERTPNLGAFAAGMSGQRPYVNAARWGRTKFPSEKLESQLQQHLGLDPLTAVLEASALDTLAQTVAEAVLVYFQEWLAYGKLWGDEAAEAEEQARAYVLSLGSTTPLSAP